MIVFTFIGIITSVVVIILGLLCLFIFTHEKYTQVKTDLIDPSQSRKSLIKLRERIDQKLAKLE